MAQAARRVRRRSLRHRSLLAPSGADERWRSATRPSWPAAGPVPRPARAGTTGFAAREEQMRRSAGRPARCGRRSPRSRLADYFRARGGGRASRRGGVRFRRAAPKRSPGPRSIPVFVARRTRSAHPGAGGPQGAERRQSSACVASPRKAGVRARARRPRACRKRGGARPHDFETTLWQATALAPDARPPRATRSARSWSACWSPHGRSSTSLGVRLPEPTCRRTSPPSHVRPALAQRGTGGATGPRRPPRARQHGRRRRVLAGSRSLASRAPAITQVAAVPWLVPGQTLERFTETFAREVIRP